MADKNQSQRQQFIEKAKNISKANDGLKDQISYMTQIAELAAKANKMSEGQFETAKDVLDKTKEIFQNRKKLTEEQIEQVDLHKLERRLISEGLQDQVKFVQKLKEEEMPFFKAHLLVQTGSEGPAARTSKTLAQL